MPATIRVELNEANSKWVMEKAAALQVSTYEVANRCVTQVMLDGLRYQAASKHHKGRRRVSINRKSPPAAS